MDRGLWECIQHLEGQDVFWTGVTKTWFQPAIPGTSRCLWQGDWSFIGPGVYWSRKLMVFLSRKLLPREARYSTIEKERYYLLRWEFDLETDHRALTWINTMKDHNARVTRWYLALQPYTFKVRHCPGRKNLVADYLSMFRDNPWPGEGGGDVKKWPSGSTGTHMYALTHIHSPHAPIRYLVMLFGRRVHMRSDWSCIHISYSPSIIPSGHITHTHWSIVLCFIGNRLGYLLV